MRSDDWFTMSNRTSKDNHGEANKAQAIKHVWYHRNSRSGRVG
jgi:hypothetical protein